MTETGIHCASCNREHQPRERSAPCRSCGTPTFAVHLVCPTCAVTAPNVAQVRAEIALAKPAPRVPRALHPEDMVVVIVAAVAFCAGFALCYLAGAL